MVIYGNGMCYYSPWYDFFEGSCQKISFVWICWEVPTKQQYLRAQLEGVGTHWYILAKGVWSSVIFAKFWDPSEWPDLRPPQKKTPAFQGKNTHAKEKTPHFFPWVWYFSGLAVIWIFNPDDDYSIGKFPVRNDFPKIQGPSLGPSKILTPQAAVAGLGDELFLEPLGVSAGWSSSGFWNG